MAKKGSGDENSSFSENYKKPKTMKKAEIDQALLENFINLQKVLTNLSIKFDELSANISKMLNLFEISAKTFAEKYSDKELENLGTNKEFIDKINQLLDQNKTISKGIMIIEDRMRNRTLPSQTMRQEQEYRFNEPFKSKQLPRD